MTGSRARGAGRAGRAVDVGGTTTAAGIVTADGDVVLERQMATHAAGAGTAQATIEALLDELRRGAGAREIVGIGVGVPAIVDTAAGVIGEEAHNVPELAGVPLASRALLTLKQERWWTAMP